jgi:hypothetical protein
MANNNPDFRVREVPVEDENGVILWPDRFVHTDDQAREINRHRADKKSYVISLESKKRKGERQYNQEMRNIPVSKDEQIIQDEWIDNHTFNNKLDLNTMNVIMEVDRIATFSKALDTEKAYSNKPRLLLTIGSSTNGGSRKSALSAS